MGGSVGRFKGFLQTSEPQSRVAVVDDVDTFISMRLNCRSWHLKDSENEKGEGRMGTRLKVEFFCALGDAAAGRCRRAGENPRRGGGRWVGG